MSVFEGQLCSLRINDHALKTTIKFATQIHQGVRIWFLSIALSESRCVVLLWLMDGNH
jgi:hypothetical protein